MPSARGRRHIGPCAALLLEAAASDRGRTHPDASRMATNPPEVPGVEQPRIQCRRHGRCPEVGRGVSGHVLDHAEIRARSRHREPAPTRPSRSRSASVLEQPIQGASSPPCPAPPGPFDRTGEHALVAGLHVDLRRTRHRGRRYRTRGTVTAGLQETIRWCRYRSVEDQGLVCAECGLPVDPDLSTS